MEKISFDQILKAILALSIWQVVKVGALLGIFLYLIFALIVIRQVNLMLNSLEVELEGLIKLVAWIHLLLVAGVFVFGLFYL